MLIASLETLWLSWISGLRILNPTDLISARFLKKLGAKKILAMTSDQGAAEISGLFDGVFGKELPVDLVKLMG